MDDFISFSTITYSLLLIYLSIVDIQSLRVENWQLLPSFIIGIFGTLHKFHKSNLQSVILILTILLIVIIGCLVLYRVGFFGGADFKVVVILFLLIDPIKNYGITSNIDGIQFFYYLLSILLIFYLLRLVKNLVLFSMIAYNKTYRLRFYEILYLCMICTLNKIQGISLLDRIIFKLKTTSIGFVFSLKSNGSIYCWTISQVPMVPIITVSVFLMMFT